MIDGTASAAEAAEAVPDSAARQIHGAADRPAPSGSLVLVEYEGGLPDGHHRLVLRIFGSICEVRTCEGNTCDGIVSPLMGEADGKACGT